jgi:hypothetical protein
MVIIVDVRPDSPAAEDENSRAYGGERQQHPQRPRGQDACNREDNSDGENDDSHDNATAGGHGTFPLAQYVDYR